MVSTLPSSIVSTWPSTVLPTWLIHSIPSKFIVKCTFLWYVPFFLTYRHIPWFDILLFCLHTGGEGYIGQLLLQKRLVTAKWIVLKSIRWKWVSLVFLRWNVNIDVMVRALSEKFHVLLKFQQKKLINKIIFVYKLYSKYYFTQPRIISRMNFAERS